MQILNLGCGTNKIKGCVNVDLLDSADVCMDIMQLSSKFEKESVDKVYLFHTIEHIPEHKHHTLVSQIWDVLKPGGRFLVSYPEFEKCALNYIQNYRGQREFWKNTIYGRQLHPGDFHVSLMDTSFFVDYLQQEGFTDIVHSPEPQESYNTIVKCSKGTRPLSREEFFNKAF